MDITLLGPLCRIPSLDFDDSGPLIDGTSLLIKSDQGFQPCARDRFDALLRERLADPFDSAPTYERLGAIARAMNAGDLGLAAIATSQLRLRMRAPRDLDVDLRKASADDPDHPGWPAGSPGGRGGKFRPLDAAEAAATAAAAGGVAFAADRAARIERLQARRSFRAAVLRVLSPKRLARLGLEVVGEAVPGVDVVDTALLVEDLAEMAAGFAENNVEVDAALAFVRQGPQTLEELMMSEGDQTFASFADFKKIDLEKVFGSAGDGYEWHHIVEQSSGLPEDLLNSTSNIIRIPKLLHEEVNAAFSRSSEILGTSLRQSLKGASFDRQKAAGIAVLKNLGIISP